MRRMCNNLTTWRLGLRASNKQATINFIQTIFPSKHCNDILHTIANSTVFEWSKFVARFTQAARNSRADYHLLTGCH